MRKEERGRGGKAHPTDATRIILRPTYWLEAVILVSLREMKSYGYELMRRVAKFGFETINPGTFYRNLRHMENEGLVRSEWDMSKRGPAQDGRLLSSLPWDGGCCERKRSKLTRKLFYEHFPKELLPLS